MSRNKKQEKGSQSGKEQGEKAGTEKKYDPSILVAIVGALATLTVAILGFPPLAEWYRSRIPPTPIPSASPTVYVIPSSVSDIPPSETPSPFSTVITLSPFQVMQIEVKLDIEPRYDGKAPFRVTINLLNSKLDLASGETSYCRNTNSCQYRIAISRNAVLLEEYRIATGIQVYTFTAAGTYIVTAEVCQDGICAEDRAEIVVK